MKRRRKPASFIVLFAMLMAVLIPQTTALAGDSDSEADDEPITTESSATEHCPDHNGHPGKVGADQSPKTVTVGGVDVLVTITGTSVTFDKEVEFCVKAANEATGKLTGTSYDTSIGEPKLYTPNGRNHPDISHVVVYSASEPEPTCTPIDASITNYRNALGLTGPFSNKGNLTDGEQTVTLDDRYCAVTVHLTSYELPSGQKEPFEDQRLYRNHSVELQPGASANLAVELPSCAYQIDLYVAPSVVDPPPHHGPTRPGVYLLDWDVDTYLGPCDVPVETARFKVTKLVTGQSTPSSDTPFAFAYDCGGDAVGTFSLEHDQHRFVEVDYAGDLPTCTITETDDHGAAEVSNTRPGETGHVAQFQLAKDWTKNTVTFTNRFETAVAALAIDAESICVAGLTTNKWGIITGGELIFEVTGSGGYAGQEIAFNYRPAGSLNVKSGTVESGGTTLASSEVGLLGIVYARIDGGTIHDRITLKSHRDCTPSVTLEKEWDNLTSEQLDELGVSVLFQDQDDNTYEPGETVKLAPGASIELTEHVDGLPEGCTWSGQGDLQWTAPALEDLEAYLAAYDSQELHQILTATNTVTCEIEVATEVLTDGFCAGFDAEIDITNHSALEVALTGELTRPDDSTEAIDELLAPNETITLIVPTTDAGTYNVAWDATDTPTGTASDSGAFSFDVIECTPSISIVKEADETLFSFGADQEDRTYEVTYTYTITNDGELPLDALTLIDDITTLGIQVDLTADLTAALEASSGSTVLDVGGSVQVHWTTTYDANEDPSTIENTATVTGVSPFGEEVSDSDDESISSIIVLAEADVDDPDPAVERTTVTRRIDTEVLAETLPRTGASILTLLISGLLALFAGGSALRRRRGQS